MDGFQRHEELLVPIVLLHRIGPKCINRSTYLHRHLQRRIWAYGLVHVR